MKIITNNNDEVDNITCINKFHNKFIYYKCIYLNKNKFELQIFNTSNFKQKIFIFDYIHNSGSILVKKGNISLTVKNKKNLKVFFKNYKHNSIYKIDYNITDKLNINIRYKSNNKLVKESVYIKYYNQCEKNKLYIRNVKNIIHTIEVNSPFELTKYTNYKKKTKYKIPRIIIQTYNTRSVNINIYNATRTWTILNPDYEYKFFDDKDCQEFIKEYFHPMVLKAFNTLKPGAFKADLFRYCYLYKKGGVYSDIDNMCLVPLNNILTPTDTFVTVKDRIPVTIFNSFMACYPGNPILNDAINRIVYNVIHKVYFNSGYSLLDALSYTGPRCLALSFNKYLGRPLLTDFKEGNFRINNVSFKLLLYRKHPYITYKNKQVIKMKYDGYTTSTNYWKLCDENNVYA